MYPHSHCDVECRREGRACRSNTAVQKESYEQCLALNTAEAGAEYGGAAGGEGDHVMLLLEDIHLFLCLHCLFPRCILALYCFLQLPFGCDQHLGQLLPRVAGVLQHSCHLNRVLVQHLLHPAYEDRQTDRQTDTYIKAATHCNVIVGCDCSPLVAKQLFHSLPCG